MSFREPQTPGIGGLAELTSAELTAIQAIAALGDPGADRMLFWDESANSYAWLAPGTNLSITGTTLNASGGGGLSDGDYGDVTISSSSTVITIDNDVVTYAKMQNVSAINRILGRITGGAGDVEELTAANVFTILGITADATELNYVDGVTSAIQTQLNAKAPSTAPTFATSITGSYLTASEILITDGSKNIVSAAVATYPSLTELTYLKGVTSAIQTQFTAKAPLASPTFTGTVTLPVGLTGVLRADTGVVSVDTDVTDIVAAASATAQGKVELATDAETVTGSDTARATTPANITAKMAAPGTIGGTTPAAATFTTVTVNTGINLAENASIALDPAGSADGKYTGITVTGTAGTTLAFGDLVYLAVADSRWELADADAASTSGDVMLGICVLAAASDGSATTILLHGIVRADTAFPALTIGAPVWVGTTAGDIQVAAPTGTDDVRRRVGFAVTADEIYFNPSQDYVTHI